MKLKDIKQGGIYMAHPSTPGQSRYYRAYDACQVVVISTRVYEAHTHHWQTQTWNIGVEYNPWKPWTRGPKYILVGELDAQMFKTPIRQGTKIKAFRLVQLPYIRMEWTDFMAECKVLAAQAAEAKAQEEVRLNQNKQVWAELKEILLQAGCPSDMGFLYNLKYAHTCGHSKVEISTVDAQFLADKLADLLGPMKD